MADFDSAMACLRDAGFGRDRPRVALILGSGWGAIEREVQDPFDIRYEDIDGFPPPAGTAGHECRLTEGALWGVPTLVFRGRYHAYEGHEARDLAIQMRIAHALGASTVILTNASGAIREDLQPGDLLAIRDHVNLMGLNPLAGFERVPGAKPFPAMGGAYDAELLDMLVQAGEQAGETIHRGVYAAVLGPSFETPAEVEMLRRLGADAVGMSTVPEAIAARALGLRVCGLSLVTNRAGGSEDSHEGTLKSAHDNAPRFANVLKALFAGL
ncbi:MAG: purine-nucleoside phosphorylase [Planctomycetes bacterium]|nr:purine-nucleoside phosphorylase [Planctomycetota bacterium]